MFKMSGSILKRICGLLYVFSVVVCAQTKNQDVKFDANFKSRYANEKFNYEGKVYNNKLSRVKGRRSALNTVEYNSETVDVEEQNNPNDSFVNKSFLTTIAYIVLISVVLYLVYISVVTKRFKNHKGDTVLQKNSVTELTSKNITNLNFNNLIQQAEADANFSLAIRYYYLMVLQQLNKFKHIDFQEDKTDSEYLLETKIKSYFNEFKSILYLYNHVWFGKFSVNQHQYMLAQQQFLSLLSQIKP